MQPIASTLEAWKRWVFMCHTLVGTNVVCYAQLFVFMYDWMYKEKGKHYQIEDTVILLMLSVLTIF